jgi:hypothetical protein
VRASLAALAALAVLPAGLGAQVTDTFPRPAADTLLVVDSVESFARLQADANVVVPTMPRMAAQGPQPPLSRAIFPRDSIDASGALTVGDVLARVPGVYLWRGGGVGRPELPNFRGRGVASVEYLLDGMPWLPAGPDSLTVDASLIPLALLERIEVERWPGLLRVQLFTRRHDRLAAASHVVLGAGPKKEATYQASIERRFASGFGFAAGADYLKVPVPLGSLGEYKNTQFWGQLSYVPTSAFGAQVQYIGATADRDAFSDGGPAGARFEGGRADLQARVFVGGTPDGLGPRLDLAYSRTGFDSAGVLHRIGQAGAAASVRGAIWAARASARYSTRWTPLDVSATASVTPVPLLTLAAEGVYRTHDEDRTSRWAGVRGGISLPGGFMAAGALRTGEAVAVPALEADQAQDLNEIEGSVGWSRSWVDLEASYARTAAFAPVAFRAFPGIVSLAPLGRTEWVTLSGRLAPLDWISVQGSFSHPQGGVPDGLPPRHYHVTGTIRSKFLRTFRSGSFDLKLELGVEGWQSGVIGRDAGGAAVVLPAATYLRSLVRLQIDSFSLFWESRNLGDEMVGYVPGFRVPRYSGLFGIRWGFVN